MSAADRERADRVALLLRLGDDRLVLGHRLSELCGAAPILEEELATGNVALDLLGQAETLLGRAGELEGAGRSADDLAFFRDVTELRNLLLVEQPNGDFAATLVRQLFFDAYDLHLAAGLESSSDGPLAAFAKKAGRDAAYHLRRSREWVVRLGGGTEESHARAQRAVDELWRFTDELFESDDVTARLVARGVTVDPAALRAPWREVVLATLAEAGVAVPETGAWMQRGGREGRHGEALGRMLSEMQSLARAHPGATW